MLTTSHMLNTHIRSDTTLVPFLSYSSNILYSYIRIYTYIFPRYYILIVVMKMSSVTNNCYYCRNTWNVLSNPPCGKLKWSLYYLYLTHWGRVTHICVSKLTIIGSNNGLSPDRRQAIIWTNAEILFIGPLGTNFNEILIEIHTFLFKKMHLKISSGKNGGHFVLASMC